MKRPLSTVLAAFILVATLLAPAKADDASSGAGSKQQSAGDKLAGVAKLMEDLQTAVAEEGKQAEKVFDEEKKTCSKRARELRNDFEDAKSVIERLTAEVSLIDRKSDDLQAKIEDLGASVLQAETDKTDTFKMKKEAEKAFEKEDEELSDTVQKLERALEVVSYESRKVYKSKSFAQMEANGAAIADALKVVLEASSLQTAGTDELVSLLESASKAKEASEEDAEAQADAEVDADLGVKEKQAPAAYSSHSGRLIELLNTILSRAQGKLQELRDDFTKKQMQFDKEVQALDLKMKYQKRDIKKSEAEKASKQAEKREKEGELILARRNMDGTALKELMDACMEKASMYEETVKSRAEEVNALEAAKKEINNILRKQAMSFLQIMSSSVQERENIKSSGAAARAVRRLAVEMKSASLIDLAGKLDYMAKGTKDPMAKVRGLIEKMMYKLQQEAIAEAEHEAFCKREMGVTEVKRNDTSEKVDKLRVDINKAKAQNSVLESEVTVLNKELTELAEYKLEITKAFKAQERLFNNAKEEAQDAIKGVRKALLILNKFYSASGKAGGGAVTGMIERVEADFVQQVTDLESNYKQNKDNYMKQVRDTDVQTAVKQNNVEYKTKESEELTKNVQQWNSDRLDLVMELDALKDYYAKLVEQCVKQPETFEERQAKRKKEIAGLNEALGYLKQRNSELQVSSSDEPTVVFLQLRGSRDTMRRSQQSHALVATGF
eukprot:TRINITY_DN581_c0_g1_i2.p1 TRINITY_DN581_c0_g1~~TRINITY_DN581_c0_g1_i2.p1  ORF type:complete len:726 (-),score=220.98 TRINITY_DN581_c0_g1_i2:235-2412(-)